MIFHERGSDIDKLTNKDKHTTAAPALRPQPWSSCIATVLDSSIKGSPMEEGNFRGHLSKQKQNAVFLGMSSLTILAKPLTAVWSHKSNKRENVMKLLLNRLQIPKIIMLCCM